MNIPGNNHSMLSEQDIMHLHQRFHELSNCNRPIFNKQSKKYIQVITLDQLKDITIELGYNPTTEELNDIAGEMTS